MYYRANKNNMASILRRLPDAVAVMNGAPSNRQIYGTVNFYQARQGVLVVADLHGLPVSVMPCQDGIFAFHIHSGAECSGSGADPFSNAGMHYNPNSCPHPYHAGDMPPLFCVGGQAFLSFLTDRFSVREIIGKAVILHDRPDDFTTQPSGNAGSKIACGIISRVRC